MAWHTGMAKANNLENKEDNEEFVGKGRNEHPLDQSNVLKDMLKKKA